MDIIELEPKEKEVVTDLLRIKEKDQKWILESLELETEKKTRVRTD